MGKINTDDLLVSVIMPAYNAGQTIVSSINSLQAQSYTNWELLVVDDHSTDDTVSIVKGLLNLDSRIKLVGLNENTGSPARPRNLAIEISSGTYIAFLDADDEWMPEKLYKQVNFMSETGATLSCSGYLVIGPDGDYIGQFSPPKLCTYEELLAHNSIGCLTAMYDARVLGKRYFPLCGHEDYALWLNILREDRCVFGIEEHLAKYRLVHGSVSSNKLKVMPFFWNIYKNLQGYSYFMSAIYCLRYAWNSRKKYSV